MPAAFLSLQATRLPLQELQCAPGFPIQSQLQSAPSHRKKIETQALAPCRSHHRLSRCRQGRGRFRSRRAWSHPKSFRRRQMSSHERDRVQFRKAVAFPRLRSSPSPQVFPGRSTHSSRRSGGREDRAPCIQPWNSRAPHKSLPPFPRPHLPSAQFRSPRPAAHRAAPSRRFPQPPAR